MLTRKNVPMLDYEKAQQLRENIPTIWAVENRTKTEVIAPDKVVKVNLPHHFNCGLIEHNGDLLLSSRKDLSCYLTKLDHDTYQPILSTKLNISHPSAPSGSEDPRLFQFRGKLFVSCGGVNIRNRRIIISINQMLCSLDDSLQVTRTWVPAYEHRTPSEKNWQFFEYKDDLYCVYNVEPHTILKHENDKVTLVSKTEIPFINNGFTIRGGAPPVRVGDEFWHVFHSVRHYNRFWEYAAALYVFEAKPPFAVKRILPDVLLMADHLIRGYNKTVCFPCGCLLKDNQLIISYGEHDRACHVAFFNVNDIEKRLIKPCNYLQYTL